MDDRLCLASVSRLALACALQTGGMSRSNSQLLHPGELSCHRCGAVSHERRVSPCERAVFQTSHISAIGPQLDARYTSPTLNRQARKCIAAQLLRWEGVRRAVTARDNTRLEWHERAVELVEEREESSLLRERRTATSSTMSSPRLYYSFAVPTCCGEHGETASVFLHLTESWF